MSDLIERAKDYATDWNGEPMKDLEPAKGDPTAGFMREVAHRIEADAARIAGLQALVRAAFSEGFSMGNSLHPNHGETAHKVHDAWDASASRAVLAKGERDE